MWALAYVISEWLIRIGMIPVVARRRSPGTALAWLGVIFFFPLGGLFLFLVFGENRLGRRRGKAHGRALEVISSEERRSAMARHIARPHISQAQHDLARLSARLGGIGPLGGNAVRLITNTEAVIGSLVEAIDAAERHVHLLFYIFRDDETGSRVAEALVRAAARGVKCRVLVDEAASRPMLRHMAHRLRKEGVEVVAALPVNLARLVLARIDLRNHRKVAVIDGRIGYVGSQNIVNADYGHKRVGAWRDMTARIVGPAALQLQEVFCQDWYFETGEGLTDSDVFPAPEQAGDVAVQLVPSGPDLRTDAFQQLLVAVIHEAEERIVMTSPYLVPEEALVLALRLAVLRGIQVDIIVPEVCDQRMVGTAARGFYPELLEAGVQIHVHQDGLLHAKTVSVDDAFGLVGSGNFDSRSFRLNFELSALLYGEHVTRELRARQLDYLKQTRELSLDEWMKRSRVLRSIESTARLVGPLL